MSRFHDFRRHCAISALKISKNYFATFDFFVKMKLVSTVWVLTSLSKSGYCHGEQCRDAKSHFLTRLCENIKFIFCFLFLCMFAFCLFVCLFKYVCLFVCLIVCLFVETSSKKDAAYVKANAMSTGHCPGLTSIQEPGIGTLVLLGLVATNIPNSWACSILTIQPDPQKLHKVKQCLLVS